MLNEKGLTTCPKCGAVSGNDWAQCGGSCPMPGSPHYHLSAASPEAPEDVAVIVERLRKRAALVHGQLLSLEEEAASALARVATERDALVLSAAEAIRFRTIAETAEAEAATLRARIAELEGKVERAGKVISFYADKANWWNDETSVNRQELFDVPMGDDLGDRARRYVEEEK